MPQIYQVWAIVFKIQLPGEFLKVQTLQRQKYRHYKNKITSTKNPPLGLVYKCSEHASFKTTLFQHFPPIKQMQQIREISAFCFFLYKITNLKNMTEFYYCQKLCRIIPINRKCCCFLLFFFFFEILCLGVRINEPPFLTDFFFLPLSNGFCSKSRQWFLQLDLLLC